MGPGTCTDISHRFSGPNLYLTDNVRENSNIFQCEQIRKKTVFEAKQIWSQIPVFPTSLCDLQQVTEPLRFIFFIYEIVSMLTLEGNDKD